MLWNAETSCANSGDHCALSFLSVTETVTDSKSKETSPILSSNSNSLYVLYVYVNCPEVAVPANSCC
jgi:hypothetical protein